MEKHSLMLVDPAAELTAATQLRLATRLTELRGAQIAVLDNSKHMVGPLLGEIQALLRDRYGVEGFSYYRKKNPSIPTPPAVLKELAESCVAAIHGVSD